jgi:primary-amine oxidase
VTWFKPLPGVQPLVLVEEYDEVPKIVKADPRWLEAMKKRGIRDVSKVWVDTWASGAFAPAGQEDARLLRAVAYLQDGAVNFYARPIEGVTAVVNMNTGKVVEVVDTGVVPISKRSAELDEKTLGKRAVAPLLITQPDGVGFSAQGHALRWQNWSLRWAMHPREGLVIYDVRYLDGKRWRKVMYRGSLSEMIVPYGDPDQHWVWRNAFDEGEYGIGRLAAPLEPELDATANAQFFDAVFSDDFGKPYTLPRAVGVYERDAGILWKHYDVYHEQHQTRRARELVVFFVTTIGNYDYAVNWVFRQDASIEVVCDLTGIMLAKGVKDKTATGHGHVGFAGGWWRDRSAGAWSQ